MYNGKGIITNEGMITGTNEGILIDGSSNNSLIENSNKITGKNAIHLKAVDQTTITNHMGASIEGSANSIVIESNAGQTNEIFNDDTIKGTSKSIVGGGRD